MKEEDIGGNQFSQPMFKVFLTTINVSPAPGDTWFSTKIIPVAASKKVLPP